MLAQVDIDSGLSAAWERIAVFVPKLLAFLVILIIGYFVAKLIRNLVARFLERVGFDRWVERGALKEPMQRSKLDASDLMALIVFWAVFLVVLQLSFGVFGPNPVSDMIAGLVAYLPNVFAAVLIVVITAAIARVVTEVLEAPLGAVGGGQWIARAAGFAILVVGVFAALNQLKIAPEIINGLFFAIVVAIAGSIIVAVGGGGIQTMRRYWDRASQRMEAEGSAMGQARASTDQTVDVRDPTEARRD